MNKIKIRKIRGKNIYNVYFDDNNKGIGRFITGDDGFYYWEAPEGSGLWADYILRWIAERLTMINKPWNNKINKMFKKQKEVDKSIINYPIF